MNRFAAIAPHIAPRPVPRSPRVPGGTYFFTARLLDPASDLLLREVGHLRAATRATKTRHPLRIDAAVVLPAALHMIWTLPAGDDDYPNRWGMLKALFSKGLPGPEPRTPAQIKRHGKGIWQPGFESHLIRNPADFALYLDFIHSAPVSAGLVARPEDWLHSSIHRQRDPAYVPEALSFDSEPAAQGLLHGLILHQSKARTRPLPCSALPARSA